MGERPERLAGQARRLRLLPGQWVTLGLVAIYRPRLFGEWWLLDYFLTVLVIAWLATFQWAALCWLMEKAGN